MTEAVKLEQFADHVRQECTRIMALSMGDDPASKRILQIAGTLCTEAADLVQQRQMQQESNGVDRYDLMSLPSPSGCSDMEREEE